MGSSVSVFNIDWFVVVLIVILYRYFIYVYLHSDGTGRGVVSFLGFGIHLWYLCSFIQRKNTLYHCFLFFSVQVLVVADLLLVMVNVMGF